MTGRGNLNFAAWPTGCNGFIWSEVPKSTLWSLNFLKCCNWGQLWAWVNIDPHPPDWSGGQRLEQTPDCPQFGIFNRPKKDSNSAQFVHWFLSRKIFTTCEAEKSLQLVGQVWVQVPPFQRLFQKTIAGFAALLQLRRVALAITNTGCFQDSSRLGNAWVCLTTLKPQIAIITAHASGPHMCQVLRCGLFRAPYSTPRAPKQWQSDFHFTTSLQDYY